MTADDDDGGDDGAAATAVDDGRAACFQPLDGLGSGTTTRVG